MPWEQTQTHIRSGHNSPEDFEQETFKTVTLNEEEGIQAVTAKPKDKETSEVVTYLFELEKGWTIEKAKQWFDEHEKKAEESLTGRILWSS